jgi:hypothetical protein
MRPVLILILPALLMAADPDEAKNLAATDRERVQSMGRELEAWLLSVVRSLNGADYC